MFSEIFEWQCPPNVTTIDVECWGAGGGGEIDDNGGSGASGCYAKKLNILVIPHTKYLVNIGRGGKPDKDGNDTFFIDKLTVLAKAGLAGKNKKGGKAAKASDNVGDIIKLGKDGGDNGADGGKSADDSNIGTGGRGDKINPQSGKDGKVVITYPGDTHQCTFFKATE